VKRQETGPRAYPPERAVESLPAPARPEVTDDDPIRMLLVADDPLEVDERAVGNEQRRPGAAESRILRRARADGARISSGRASMPARTSASATAARGRRVCSS